MTTTKRDPYISFNTEEMKRLGHLDYDAHVLYFIIKQKVNFKTGEFGKFGKQHITYLDLAEAMYRPGSPGKTERDSNTEMIRHLLEVLEAANLITDRDDSQGRLTMLLPLSKKWPQRKSAATAEDSPAAPAVPGVLDKDAGLPISAVSPSVMITTVSNDLTDGSMTTTDDEKNPPISAEVLKQLDELFKAMEEEERLASAGQAMSTFPNPSIAAAAGESGKQPAQAGEVKKLDSDAGNPSEEDALLAAAPAWDEWQDMLAASRSGNFPEQEGWESREAERWEWLAGGSDHGQRGEGIRPA